MTDVHDYMYTITAQKTSICICLVLLCWLRGSEQPRGVIARDKEMWAASRSRWRPSQQADKALSPIAARK